MASLGTPTKVEDAFAVLDPVGYERIPLQTVRLNAGETGVRQRRQHLGRFVTTLPQLDITRSNLVATRRFTTGRLKIEGDLMKSQLIEKLFKF